MKFNLKKIKKILRAIPGLCSGALIYPIAWFWPSRPKDPIAQAVSEILMMGFYGSHCTFSARLLARQAKKGDLGGIFFVNQNIGSTEQVKSLIKLFKEKKGGLLLAIDHEGGVVQRLNERHCFTPIPCARIIANRATIERARQIYQLAGQELYRFGFNVNLGPVLDFDDPENQVIGMHGRSFGDSPELIQNFGKSFIEGFASAGIVCTLKHFPGHGYSIGDSHDSPADISKDWTTKQIEPFANLITDGYAPMIMSGHLKLSSIDPSGTPATLSYPITSQLLRGTLKYDGVIVTDDLDMGAISCTINRRGAIIKSLQAGNDLLMIKNLFGYDPLLPRRALKWIRQAIGSGELSEENLFKSAERIRDLKRRFHIIH